MLLLKLLQPVTQQLSGSIAQWLNILIFKQLFNFKARQLPDSSIAQYLNISILYSLKGQIAQLLNKLVSITSLKSSLANLKSSSMASQFNLQNVFFSVVHEYSSAHRSYPPEVLSVLLRPLRRWLRQDGGPDHALRRKSNQEKTNLTKLTKPNLT